LNKSSFFNNASIKYLWMLLTGSGSNLTSI
jgi:hypothetical protein